jgi:hypothetical protein
MRPYKRKNIRVTPAYDRPLKVYILGEDFVEVTNALNISLGGIAINIKHRFEGCKIDKKIDLVIDIPLKKGVTYIKAEGLIRWVRGDEFAVEFTDITQVSNEILSNYIHRRLGVYSKYKQFLFYMGIIS